jgi:hypothetical protein
MVADTLLYDDKVIKTKSQDQSKYVSKPLEKVFHSAAARIVDFLIIYRDFDYSESDLARKTRLTYKTIAKEVPLLLDNEIITFTRLHGRSKMYKINDQSERVKGLIQFIDGTAESNLKNFYSN